MQVLHMLMSLVGSMDRCKEFFVFGNPFNLFPAELATLRTIIKSKFNMQKINNLDDCK